MTSMRVGAGLLGMGFGIGVASCKPDAFECEDATQCLEGGQQGVCQPTGFCSFPDDACPSGQRYGDLAKMGLAGTCVPTDGAGTDATTGPSSTSGSAIETGTGNQTDPETSGVVMTGSDDTGECMPDCAGKACGPDGCGGSCAPGCGADAQCDSGTCVTDCPSTWRTPAGTTLAGAVLQPSGFLFVAGEHEEQAWVAALSPCTGELERSTNVTLPDTSESRAMDLALSGNDLFLVGHALPVGSQSKDAIAARLDASDLTVEWSRSLEGGGEEGWGVDVLDGSMWAAGVSGVATDPMPWMFTGDTDGVGCGFGAFFGEGVNGVARTLVATPNGIHVAGSFDESGYIVRFDPGSCFTSPPCGCFPVWMSMPLLGAMPTEVRQIEVFDDVLYAAGMTLDSDSDYQAFVARIDVVTGEVIGAWTWNPTDDLDAVLGLGSDEDTIYAAGVTNYDETEQNVAAYLIALPRELTFGTRPIWTAEIPFMGSAWDVAVGDEGLYVVGRNATDSSVARCTKDGLCPQ